MIQQLLQSHNWAERGKLIGSMPGLLYLCFITLDFCARPVRCPGPTADPLNRVEVEATG